MNTRKTINSTWKIALPLILGGAILYWMYRDFDFSRIYQVMTNEMNWTWMLLSFPFGILAQAIRGWRWKQTLSPIGEESRASVRVHSIFLSYALSLIIPRSGEFARCGVLTRWDNVSFPKALGTVFTERIIDSLLVLLICGSTLLWQYPVFHTFFSKTGTSIDSIFHSFTLTGWIVTGICLLAALILLWLLFRRLTIYKKVKETLQSIYLGVTSLQKVHCLPLFSFWTIGIWVSYFLHYYLTFFCFEATSQLGIACALVTFIVGSMSVIVPTPNGAGPWHFAVKTMLILYGVAETDALYFVLIVHTVQTLLVILLGIYAWVALSITKRRREK